MLTITDLFCGAGGSSSGAEQVPGVRVRMAANHWALAVETHNRNLPHADHDTADISQVEPRRYPRTDILWASPECTNHSQARGVRRGDHQPDLFGETLPDEAAVRSRSTMMDVLRFAEIHRYRAIVVENVVDVRDWILWPAWVMGLDNLGYDHQVVYLNSMFAQQVGAPAPQSRDRLYVVAWRRGNRAPDLARWTRPPAWCPTCEQTVRPIQAWKSPERQRGRYRQQYVWRCPTSGCRHAEVYPGVLPAAAAIDWALAGERIGDRVRPLAAKTVARIEAGLRRYARPTPPFIALLRNNATTHQIDEPLNTMSAGGGHHGLVNPMLVPAGGTWNDSAQPVTEPFRTRTTRDTEALVVPVEGRDNLAARSAGEPGRTQTARQQDALVVPLRNSGVARPAGEAPAPTVAAAGNHHALVMRNMTARGDQGQMSYPPSEPMRTVLAEQRQSLVRWDHLLVPYYGTAVARRVDQPSGTVTTVDRNALVGPQVAVEDCTFRMLQPHEIQAAMAFAVDYQVLWHGDMREVLATGGHSATPGQGSSAGSDPSDPFASTTSPSAPSAAMTCKPTTQKGPLMAATITAVDRSDCPAPPGRHGTSWRYVTYKCRCDDAIADRRRRNNRNRPRPSTSQRIHPGGRITGYDQLSVDIGIERATHGGPAPFLSDPERRAVVDYLTRNGWSAYRIGAALGIAVRSVVRHRHAIREATANQAAA